MQFQLPSTTKSPVYFFVIKTEHVCYNVSGDSSAAEAFVLLTLVYLVALLPSKTYARKTFERARKYPWENQHTLADIASPTILTSGENAFTIHPNSESAYEE